MIKEITSLAFNAEYSTKLIEPLAKEIVEPSSMRLYIAGVFIILQTVAILYAAFRKGVSRKVVALILCSIIVSSVILQLMIHSYNKDMEQYLIYHLTTETFSEKPVLT